ncbi:methionyl-tRNA formyltransferase [Patescibacteria group bacterium]|nr:methionyl-tRNA formyltransferase [Patescibacteria group bacterium]
MNKSFVYFGTSDFADIILTGLLKAGLRPVLVVTTLPQAKGRGLKKTSSPVGLRAVANQLELLESPSLKNVDIKKQLAKFKTDFAVLAAFGQIVPASVLVLYPKGIVNVHPSLLPLYRGASPIASALLAGQFKTGVSLMLLDDLMDHGPLLKQVEYLIKEKDNALTLSQALAGLAGEILPNVLIDYLSGKIKPVAQDHSLATYTKLISRSDGRANFNLTAEQLNNLRRAFYPWPGLWTTWRGQVVKLLQTEVLDVELTKPGLVKEYQNQGLSIDCQSGSILVKEIQLAGRKPMLAGDFIRGQASFVGTVLQ